MGAKQTRRLRREAKKALKKKYGTIRKARKETGIKSVSRLLSHSAQNLVAGQQTSSYKKSLNKFTQRMEARAQSKASEAHQKAFTRTPEYKAHKGYQDLMKIRLDRQRKELQKEFTEVTEGMSMPEVIEALKETPQENIPSGTVLKEINTQEKQPLVPGFTGTTGDNISVPPENLGVTNEQNNETNFIRDPIFIDESTVIPSNIRIDNVPIPYNNKNNNKPNYGKSSDERKELIKKYYSDLSDRAIDSLFYRDFGFGPEEVLRSANDKNFGQENRPETKIVGSFLSGYAKIPEELYDPTISKSENIDKLYNDIKELHKTKFNTDDNRILNKDSTAKERADSTKAFLEYMATLAVPGSSFLSQTGKGLLFADANRNALGDSLSPENIKKYSDNLRPNYHGQKSWLAHGLNTYSKVGGKVQSGFKFLENNFNPYNSQNFAEHITNWPPYIVGTMGNYGIERPGEFIPQQRAFKTGVQALNQYITQAGKKIRISPRTASILSRGTADTADVVPDLIETLPYLPKEAWPGATVGIIGTNYALDRGIDITKIKPQQAISVVQAPFKEYHPGWSLDPSGSFTSMSTGGEFQPRETILNPETPLRLNEQEIENLNKAIFTGKTAEEIVLPKRTNFEKHIISFGKQNPEAVLKGSRSFYAQALKNIDFDINKDADYSFPQGTNLEKKAKEINDHFFKGKGKIKSFETDIGTVYNVKKGESEVEIMIDDTPSIQLPNKIRLSEANHEIKKKWSTSLEYKKTIKRAREKDLPKLEEALQIYEHNLKQNPLFKEDIFIHSGNLPRFSSFTPKIKTPTSAESAYGEGLHPILYGGQNEMISFFRKGGFDVLRLHENKKLKFLRGKDLPKKFRFAKGNIKQRNNQAKEYLNWLSKNYPEGVVAPSAHTIAGIDFEGRITNNVEKEWIYYGDLPKISHTGFGFDPMSRYSNNFPIVNIVSNKKFPDKKIYKRILKPFKNIKNIFKDINKLNKYEESIFLRAKKIKNNLKNKKDFVLSSKDKQTIKLAKKIESYYRNKLSQNYKYADKLKRNNKYKNNNYYNNNYRNDQNRNTNNRNDRIDITYQNLRTNKTNYKLQQYKRKTPTYNYYNNIVRRPEQTKTPTRIRTPINNPPEEFKLKIKKRKQSKLLEGYAPIFYKDGFKVVGQAYDKRELAEWEGMEVVDKNPITEYKVEKIQTDKPVMKSRKPYKAQNKFSTNKKGIRKEKRYYAFDKKGERKGSFNMFPYIYSK